MYQKWSLFYPSEENVTRMWTWWGRNLGRVACGGNKWWEGASPCKCRGRAFGAQEAGVEKAPMYLKSWTVSLWGWRAGSLREWSWERWSWRGPDARRVILEATEQVATGGLLSPKDIIWLCLFFQSRLFCGKVKVCSRTYTSSVELAVCHQARVRFGRCLSKVSYRGVEGGLEKAEMKRQTRSRLAADKGP